MRDGGADEGPERVGARALREWITGERQQYGRVFLVESGAAADAVFDVAGDDDVVLLPDDGGPCPESTRIVRYSGALGDIGDELFLGERGVELQDYVAAGFVQIVGPTVVCLFGASDVQAFLEDAELARRTGVFPSALIDPRVLLANRGALARPDEIDTPSALRIGAGGTVSVGVHGEPLGRIDELPDLLATPLPRAAALGGIVPEDALAAELRNRDGIGRYLGAAELMKILHLPNGAAKISGFGWSLVVDDDDLADAEPLTADPFLLDTADGFVLADIATLRRQLLSPETAGVVVATQTSSTLEIAAERVARQLGTSSSEASALCREAVAALGIHTGRRARNVRATKDIAR